MTRAFRSALYRGELVHVRRDAFARRTFRYPVYMASIDPSELPAMARALRLFSHNSRGLFSLDDADYEGASVGGVEAAHARGRAAEGLPAPASLRLITNLKVAGYVFNPVSFALGYNQAGKLDHAVAEVNNNYGGRHRYVLDSRCEVPGRVPRYRQERTFFVSPFLHGPMQYDFQFDAPLDGARLDIQMDVQDDSGTRVFVAHLSGKRIELSDRALLAMAVRYPLMTMQVIGLIYFQALKLRLSGVPYRAPGPDHRPRPAEPAPVSPSEKS